MLKKLLLMSLAIPSIANAAFTPPYSIMSFIYDYDVQKDGSYSRVTEKNIRIDTPQGIDQYGQAKIYYDGKRDKLEILDAYTIRPTGEKVTVTPDRIKRINAETEDEAPYFSDQMTAVIIFPQVEVGSQLYYKAVLTEEHPIVSGRFGTMITFTPHRRYDDAIVRLTHPSDMPLQAYARGIEGNRTILSDGRIQYEYHYKQGYAYPLETDQVTYEDFSSVVQFSNYQSYADLAKVTNDLFQPKTKVTERTQKLADELILGAKSSKQKAQIIYDWVSKNIRYVGIDVGASGFEPHYADEILEHQYGDCKDHAVILETLLAAAGVSSSPVLINISDSYQLPQLAGKYYFNHVITYVPEMDIYLDSTAQFAEFGTLPAEAMGKPVLIIQNGNIRETPVSSPIRDYTVTNTKLRLLKDGSVVGSSEYIPHGYFTTSSRTAQFSYENKNTQTVVDMLLKRFLETGTGELIHQNPTDLSTKWRVDSKFKLDPVINLPGPSAMSIPTGLTPGYIKLTSNTKPYENRRYPYNCGSSMHIENIELSIPNTVRVTRIPRDLNVKSKEQTYQSTYRLVNNKLHVTRQLTTNVQTDVCKPNQPYTKELSSVLNQVKSDLRSQIFIE